MVNNRKAYKAKNNTIGMGEILLLEEVFNEVVSNKEEYTLFGRRDYKIRDKVFDFLLHYIKGIPIDKFESDLMIVPVLKYQSPQYLTMAKLSMYDINKRNQNISTFALRGNNPRFIGKKNEEKIVYGTFLKFFDVKRTGCGSEIISRDDYRVAGKEDFIKHFSNWNKINKFVLRLRSEIDKKYMV